MKATAATLTGGVGAPMLQSMSVQSAARLASSAPRASAEPADEALLERIASGDPHAARAFVRRHSPMLLAIGRRLLRDAAEAEDVAQETFVKAFDAAENWSSSGGGVRGWLAKVATRLCFDRLRKQRPTPMAEPPEETDPAPDPARLAEAASRSALIERAIDALPERQRAAIELCYRRELSNIEAARALDISVDALESLLARGRRALKAKLQALEGAW